MEFVNSPMAPKAIGPYSQAVVHNDILYLSGQIALDPSGERDYSQASVVEQTQRLLQNLAAVLEAGGSERGKVLRVGIFLTDMQDFAEVNRVYEDFFGEHKPARFCVAVSALPRGMKVEMEATAYL